MLKQQLSHKQLQKLSPQQIQLMKLLQLPTVALEQRIKEEMEGNPALEEGKEDDEPIDELGDEQEEGELTDEEEFDFSDYLDDQDTPDYKLYAKNKGKDDDDSKAPLSVGQTFHEFLESQLSMLEMNEHREKVTRHIVGSVDESGYLRRDLDSIVDDLAFTQNLTTTKEELEELLQTVQEFDPPGVGARSLKECLLIQIRKKDRSSPSIENAIKILENHFDAFTKKHYSKITKKLEISTDDLKDAIEEILKLNPKPGNSLSDTDKTVQQVVPDFTLSIKDGDLDLTLNGRNAPMLRVSDQYVHMMEKYSTNRKNATKKDKEAALFVKQKLDSAKWFIDAIKQRQDTLIRTMTAIMERQREYFLEGDERLLKPMILKDIAEKVNLDISTISRVVNSKYVLTPYGTFLLKSFFSESLSTDSGEEVSTREVKSILQDVLEKEDKKKPLTDERLSKILKNKGYNIARRTVAKYREQLHIPVARLRKEL